MFFLNKIQMITMDSREITLQQGINYGTYKKQRKTDRRKGKRVNSFSEVTFHIHLTALTKSLQNILDHL